jgi:hypothetical protein
MICNSLISQNVAGRDGGGIFDIRVQKGVRNH